MDIKKCNLTLEMSPTLFSKRNATFLRGFFLEPRVRVITPDSLVYTLLQKKRNLRNVAFLLEKSVPVTAIVPCLLTFRDMNLILV